MTIFAPKSEAVVLFAGHEHDRSRLSRLLGRVLGLYVFLAVAVAAVGSLRNLLAPAAPTADRGVSLGAESAADGGGGVATETARGGFESLLVNPDPLLVFFLGGLVAIVVLTGYWYATGR
jgi:hypothetical protein